MIIILSLIYNLVLDLATVRLLLLLVVTNDLICALEKKQHCAALFVDLSKAFDSVECMLPLNKLRNSGFGPKAVKWSRNYFVDQTQCVHEVGHILIVLR